MNLVNGAMKYWLLIIGTMFILSCTQGSNNNGINTTGAEDTPFISHDGMHLYFNYSPMDFYTWQNESAQNKTNRQYVLDNLISGPWRTGFSESEFMSNTGYGLMFFKTFVSTKTGTDQWSEPEVVRFADPAKARPIMSVSQDELTAFVLCPDMNLCISTRSTIGGLFSDPQLVATVNSSDVDDDHRISSDGLLIFFDSTRAFPASVLPGPHIWVSQFNGSGYDAPTAITAINSADQEFEKFPFFQVETSTLFFIQVMVADGTKRLMRSQKTGSVWSTPTEITTPGINTDNNHPPVAVSLPGSGDRIYFEYGVPAVLGGRNTENYDIYFAPYTPGVFGTTQPLD